MRKYNPRRQSKRWLDGDCPAEVLALYDNRGRTADRYTVLYRSTITDHRGNVWITGRAMNSDPMHPQGIGLGFEQLAHAIASWRYRVRHEAVRWTDLPPRVQECIRLDCKESSQ